jgi:putative tricarboxylic transport membrane protein
VLHLLFNGFAAVLNLHCILLLSIGVAVGIIFGAIPGLTGTMAISLCLPMTFGMNPIAGFCLLIGLYIGGISGGLISAILLKIPGTPSSVATCFDGHPMAARGEGGKALGVGIIYSFIGTLISIILLMFIAPPLANFALVFGPFEYFSLGIFAITMIASLVGGSPFKGLASGAIGLCLAMVGSAPLDAAARFTFGMHEFDAGFNLLPVLIGLFAISEILMAAQEGLHVKKGEIRQYSIKGFGISLKEFYQQFWNMIRSALIGVGIGILPGIGGGTSNLIAYLTAKNQSKYPEKFGTGIVDGIVASETSNNASIGGAMIPLLTLGIPGDTVTALLLGALVVHGLTPGPLLFTTSANLVYAIFAALLLASLIMVIMEYGGLRVFVKLLTIPKYILLPVIVVLCAVGSYALNNRLFDVWTILIFGIIGFLMEKFGFSLTPVILGFILGPIIETNLRRGLMFSQGDFLPFVTRPISVIFLLIALITVVLAVKKNLSQPKKKAATEATT